MAYTFNPFTGNFDVADVVTFSPPAVDLTPYELKVDSEARDKDLQDQIDALEAAAFDEAPQDGTPYSRQDAGWVSVSVFIDAPIDGKQYVRKDGVWEEVVIGSGDFEEPPADDEAYARTCPSTQVDPSNPVGDWLKLNHLDPAKVWIRNTSDPNFTEADGVRPNDIQYVPDTDKLFLYRDVFGDQSAYYWVQMLYTPPGGSGGGIPEAPANGEPYVRIDRSWQKLSDFGAGGGGPFVDSVAVTAPLKDAGSATAPNLGVDLTTLPSSS